MHCGEKVSWFFTAINETESLRIIRGLFYKSRKPILYPETAGA